MPTKKASEAFKDRICFTNTPVLNYGISIDDHGNLKVQEVLWSTKLTILVSLDSRTAERRGRKNAYV